MKNTIWVSVFLILTSSVLTVYPQENYEGPFITKQFLLRYYDDTSKNQTGSPGVRLKVEKGGFERITFLNDSTVRFGNVNNSSLDLNISDIERLTFKRKGNTGLWITAGIVGGALVGSLMGYAIGSTSEGSTLESAEAGMAGVGVALLTTIAGGIIGGNAAPNADETYYLNKVLKNKKDELVRIIKANKKEY
ncbi:MAG: hypothetical protein K1X85_01285 [Ignavibacteria bacterium]|nr:hypothetical protein [Ignavibacteria bacterium]